MRSESRTLFLTLDIGALGDLSSQLSTYVGRPKEAGMEHQEVSCTCRECQSDRSGFGHYFGIVLGVLLVLGVIVSIYHHGL